MNRWEKVKLSALCTRIGDGLHGTPIYVEDSDIYFINGNNLRNGNIIIDSDTKRVSSDELAKNYIPLNDNSLLIGINGTLGNMAFYKGEKLMLGKSAAYLNFKTNISKFYYYYFQLPAIQSNFYDIATGSTIKNLSLKSLQDFEVPKPSENEYLRIVAVLSALDDKIKLNNRINAELEQMAKIIYDYWFVQFDFPDAQGKPYRSSGGEMVYNEVLKRRIPEGWEVKKLGDFGSLKNGINYDPKEGGDTKANIINVRNISQSSIFIGNEDLDVLELKNADVQKYLVNENSIIIARSGIPGATRLIKNFFPNTIYCGFIICFNLHEFAFQNYIFYNLKIVESNLTSQSNGTIMKNINQQVLNDINIIVPDDKALQAFNAKINPLFQKIQVIMEQNRHLSSLRDWLLPMLMNGQVRVDDSSIFTNENLSAVVDTQVSSVKRSSSNISNNKKDFAK